MNIGYVIQERLPGVFQSERAIQLGVPKGPLIAKLLKEGILSLATPSPSPSPSSTSSDPLPATENNLSNAATDATNHVNTSLTIRLEDCLGPPRLGRKLVLLGDTKNSDSIEQVLIISPSIVICLSISLSICPVYFV